MENTYTITGRSNYAVICIDYTNDQGQARTLACLILDPQNDEDVARKIQAEIVKNETK